MTPADSQRQAEAWAERAATAIHNEAWLDAPHQAVAADCTAVAIGELGPAGWERAAMFLQALIDRPSMHGPHWEPVRYLLSMLILDLHRAAEAAGEPSRPLSAIAREAHDRYFDRLGQEPHPTWAEMYIAWAKSRTP